MPTAHVDDQGRLSLLVEGEPPGFPALAPWLATPSAEHAPRLLERAETEEGVWWRVWYEALELEETLRCRLSGDGSAELERALAHHGATPVEIADAGLDGSPRFGGCAPADGRLYHTDHARTESLPWSRPEYPCLRPLPKEPQWYGDQESQPIPALALMARDGTEALVAGQLEQRFTRMRFHVGAGRGSVAERFRVSWRCIGAAVPIPAGGALSLEPAFFQILADVRAEQALDGYNRAVVRRGGLERQQRNALRHTGVYGTWNYGYMRHIDAEKVRATARHVAEQLPGLSFFLIDGGWVNYPVHCRAPHMGDFHRPEREIDDREKFPEGMRGMARELRELGLRPALHWTPFINLGSAIARDHPEWLMRDERGGLYRIGRNGYLDYSLPEVQRFLHETLGTIAHEWGFEGIKLDFWSQAVEDPTARYRHGGTGIEWREWLLSTVRSYLPEDGFLMTAVATAMGNPFLGRHVETYRACIDIGHCESWRRHRWACAWLQPLLAQPGRELGLMNADAVGVSRHFTVGENLHRLTYALITQGSIEVDGPVEELEAHETEWLRRLTTHMDRGHPVRCPDDQAFTGEPFPTVLYVDYPPESVTARRGVAKQVALLNWDERPALVGACAEKLGLEGPVTAREFWTDEQVRFERGDVWDRLPGHGARLYEIPADE